MYAKMMQNTKFVYILYTKIVQIKICTEMNVYTKNVHQIFTYIEKTSNCTKLVQSSD